MRRSIAWLLCCWTTSLLAAQVDDRATGLVLPSGFVSDVVLSEPAIAKPVFLNFDERGRLWVVEFRQYPDPAGLTRVSRDQFWRSIYDRVPPPPPGHIPGRDRISVWSSSRQDGVFDQQRVVFNDLNIATAIERGRGGMWVLNPPYLLFYPDADLDDVPDAPPTVHLAGFGLEDTHAVANSLRWGPDGWLYGAVGSTVTSHLIRPGLDREPLLSLQGQGIWRYHPATRRCEIFAEGGGNTFGLELDDLAQVFSGHNGADTRGFHYIQGAYEQKGFDKHGPLSNPYAFGYFRPLRSSNRIPRFSHTLAIYGGGAFPAEYVGRMFSLDPLHGTIVLSTLDADGSTWRTSDAPEPFARSASSLFRPVDIKTGPDGALYVCDWRDLQVNHYRNHEGQIARELGGIWRIRTRDAAWQPVPDLAALDGAALIGLLGHANRWYRQTAQRLIADRNDPTLRPALRALLKQETGQLALEALWALGGSGGLDTSDILTGLQHPFAGVRAWAVRLAADASQLDAAVAPACAALAASEPDVLVRTQLACSARRLPRAQGFPIIAALIRHHDADADDARQPLNLWWALEAWMTQDLSGTVQDVVQARWTGRLFTAHLIERICRRAGVADPAIGLPAVTAVLAALDEHAAAEAALRGFGLALVGRPLPTIPEPLQRQLDRHGGGPLPLALRARRPGAVERVRTLLSSTKTDVELAVQCLAVIGELALPELMPDLLRLVTGNDARLGQAATAALQRYDDPTIASTLLQTRATAQAPVRTAIDHLLVSRVTSARLLVDAVRQGHLRASDLDAGVVNRLRLLDDAELRAQVEAVLRPPGKATTAAMEQEIARLRPLVATGGDPRVGQELFQARCGSCHRLFEHGGAVGPDLTGFKRDDVAMMLLAIINPGAEIREGYEAQSLTTHDGRALFGFLAGEQPDYLVLRGLDGSTTTVPRNEIASRTGTPGSLMPEGLLAGLDDAQVRDLFAFLRLTQPLPRRR